MSRAFSLAVVAVCGCAAPTNQPRVVQLPNDVPHGISDVTSDGDNRLWAIAERDPVVVEISIDANAGVTGITRHPIVGLPPGVDTEAITSLGQGRFAFGIEDHDHPYAAVMYGQLRSDGAIEVSPAFSMDDAQLGVNLVANAGVEGICGDSNGMLVGIETKGVMPDGTRYSPVVRVVGADKHVQRLRFTTDHGKLSALTCQMRSDGSIDLLAIERDYGVTRVLHAVSHAGQVDIPTEVVIDLWPLLRDQYNATVNMESIARLPDNRIVMLNDNQGKGSSGPTRLFIFSPR